MGHLRDGTETEVSQLRATIKQQEDMLAQKAIEIAYMSSERDALQGALKTKGENVAPSIFSSKMPQFASDFVIIVNS